MEFTEKEGIVQTIDTLSLCIHSEEAEAALESDHEFLSTLPEAAVLCKTKEFLTVVIMRTAYSRVQLRLQIPLDYPNECPIVELSSATLPLPLLRNKEKECVELAKKILGKPQAKVIYDHVSEFIQTNMFIPCWREMKQLSSLCEGVGGKLGCDDKTGEISVRVQCKNYKQNFSLKVPSLYPECGVEVVFKASTFPAEFQYMFRCQAVEIVRRCEAGHSPDAALHGTVNLDAATRRPTTEPKIKLTTESLQGLKRDVNVLKQICDLRETTSQTAKGYQGAVTADKREARKDLRRLAKEEIKMNDEQQRELRELEQQEMKELMGAKVSGTAQPSLYAAARFLIEEFVLKLPQEVCQACKQLVFAENPEDKAMVEKHHKRAPLRTFCGHFLHYECLNEWLTTPPFIRNCGACDRRIWHPDWPDDIKILEKAWQNQQAKKREMADVADLMGF